MELFTELFKPEFIEEALKLEKSAYSYVDTCYEAKYLAEDYRDLSNEEYNIDQSPIINSIIKEFVPRRFLDSDNTSIAWKIWFLGFAALYYLNYEEFSAREGYRHKHLCLSRILRSYLTEPGGSNAQRASQSLLQNAS